MDIVKDQADLLCAFNAHGVDYLVVGGHAVNAYTQARSTNDLDILIRNSEENALRAVEGPLLDVPVRFISRAHLIAAKLAAGRRRDLGDVDELQKFAREQEK